MREFEGIRILETADELLDFLSQDPLDRILDYRDDHFLTVVSMKALGVSSINQYVKARQNCEPGADYIHKCTLAVIALKKNTLNHNCSIPPDILSLCKSAKDLAPGRLLSWAGFEGLCVLSNHPDAEVGEANWFQPAESNSEFER